MAIKENGSKRKKKHILNQMKTEFYAVSENERLSRAMICAMAAQLDITVDDLADVRCAVSEAVTNVVVHAYKGDTQAKDDRQRTVYILTTLYDDRSIKIIIRDRGCGIGDIPQAMEPLYTTDMSGERSGMGFAIMQNFMDAVRVKSAPGRGTTVEMRKKFAPPVHPLAEEKTEDEGTIEVPGTQQNVQNEPSGHGQEGIA